MHDTTTPQILCIKCFINIMSCDKQTENHIWSFTQKHFNSVTAKQHCDTSTCQAAVTMATVHHYYTGYGEVSIALLIRLHPVINFIVTQ